MSCLPRGFPAQKVFIKKTLCYVLYLVANSHNIQVWVYSKGHRQSFIEECIVRDLAWLLSIILMLNVLVQTAQAIICQIILVKK